MYMGEGANPHFTPEPINFAFAFRTVQTTPSKIRIKRFKFRQSIWNNFQNGKQDRFVHLQLVSLVHMLINNVVIF